LLASPPPQPQLSTPKGGNTPVAKSAKESSASGPFVPPLNLDGGQHGHLHAHGHGTHSTSTSLVEPKTTTVVEEVSLDTIVRQFLFDQHRRCAKPYSVVPEFSLRHKHQCFVPKPNDQATVAPMNVTRRLLGRQIGASYSHNNSKQMWRRFKYSKYKYVRKAYADENSALCAVEFLDDSSYNFPNTFAAILTLAQLVNTQIFDFLVCEQVECW
jgi:hypothetical protein